jgi:hypothetical protein
MPNIRRNYAEEKLHGRYIAKFGDTKHRAFPLKHNCKRFTFSGLEGKGIQGDLDNEGQASWNIHLA